MNHLSAYGIALLSIIATTAVWIRHLQLGPPLDPWTGGPMLLFVPVILILFSLGWLVIRFIMQKFIQLSTIRVVVVSFLLLLIGQLLICGTEQCFSLGSSERGVSWFLIGGGVFFALVHHYFLVRFQQKNATSKVE